MSTVDSNQSLNNILDKLGIQPQEQKKRADGSALGQEDFLMTLLERIHHQCVGKEDDAINMRQMKDKYIQEYKKIKKQKDM